VVSPRDERPAGVERLDRIEYADLTSGARSELEYAVAEIVADEERRFVDFYNDAQPITLRLHQLNLLPGIGKKLRNNILDERERGPFESFSEVEERVDGLHDPAEKVVERIIEELRDEDLKYRTFVDAS
jgi:putative nucleotide binding protein